MQPTINHAHLSVVIMHFTNRHLIVAICIIKRHSPSAIYYTTAICQLPSTLPTTINHFPWIVTSCHSPTTISFTNCHLSFIETNCHLPIVTHFENSPYIFANDLSFVFYRTFWPLLQNLLRNIGENTVVTVWHYFCQRNFNR